MDARDKTRRALEKLEQAIESKSWARVRIARDLLAHALPTIEDVCDDRASRAFANVGRVDDGGRPEGDAPLRRLLVVIRDEPAHDRAALLSNVVDAAPSLGLRCRANDRKLYIYERGGGRAIAIHDLDYVLRAAYEIGAAVRRIPVQTRAVAK